MLWRTGPDLPNQRTGMASVQLEDTFLAVGGTKSRATSQAYYDTILQYDNINEGWIEIPQKIPNGGFYAAAILLPEDAIDCS